MHLHILGIGGTFMVGLARLALELGHRVTGADRGLYPPMSTQLAALGIEVADGYGIESLAPRPDLVIIGNALSRGSPVVEYVLDHDIPYTSGPAWLRQAVLGGRRVIAVAGTHGKTTTASLVAWMLDHAGLAPGFLVGGVLENFGVSARLGSAPHFVIEADEYDTAFFDKRSKFVHYRPSTLVINNLEFDHAVIFPDLAAIERQFHHLVRTLPGRAVIVRPTPDPVIDGLLARGCWSRVQSFGEGADADLRVTWDSAHPATLTLTAAGGPAASGSTPLHGRHNACNVAAAAAAAATVGVTPARALAALPDFANVKRRLELRGTVAGVRVYDDFAHHPTAIAATIAALRPLAAGGRIVAVTEPRSNTQRLGVQRDAFADALAAADEVLLLDPGDLPWDLAAACAGLSRCAVHRDHATLAGAVAAVATTGDCVLVMSNGAFGNLHQRILDALGERC